MQSLITNINTNFTSLKIGRAALQTLGITDTHIFQLFFAYLSIKKVYSQICHFVIILYAYNSN